MNNAFKVGLCMAGAISAGAYTAGAMDFLLEALEEWQRRKEQGIPNTPNHQVQISVIGGASAGGMTGIVTASAISDPIEPVRIADSDLMSARPNNKLYHSWVDLVSDEMMNILLHPGDISKKNGVKSILNADFIDEIAERVINVSDNPPIRRAYIHKNLKVFVTLSNLDGMDYSVTFRSNSPKFNRYVISSHNDYACFKLCDSEDQYTNDGWIPLNFKTKLNTDIAKQAALATGAFPVGLKAREVSRSSTFMNHHAWFHHITKDAQHPFDVDPYKTINVDGGMINNEPFERVRELLSRETKQSKAADFDNYDKFKSTIIMIDPFPSEPGDFDSSTGLTTIIGNTLGAIIGQARVKPSVLVDAMDSKKAGQFLIAPVRYDTSGGTVTPIEGKKAIACGSLGGFGGFISKEFRIHDYFLGRANCEKFLCDHFTVPSDTDNEIFVNGYKDIADKSHFTSKSDGGLQIIPIFTERKSAPYMPVFSNGKQWPAVPSGYITSYLKMVKKRVEKVLFTIAEYSRTQRVLLWIGAKVVLNGKIADSILEKVKKSLEDHKLIS